MITPLLFSFCFCCNYFFRFKITNNIVKTFEIEFVPLIEDIDFFNKWEKSISKTTKNTETIEVKKYQDLNIEYFDEPEDRWYGEGKKKLNDINLDFSSNQNLSIKTFDSYNEVGEKIKQIVVHANCDSKTEEGKYEICSRNIKATYDNSKIKDHELKWTYNMGTSISSNSRTTLSANNDVKKQTLNIDITWKYQSDEQLANTSVSKTFWFEKYDSHLGKTQVTFIRAY